MSNWPEDIPHGPLTEQDFIKLGSVLQMKDSYDGLSKDAIKIAEQRLSYPERALSDSTQKVIAEYTSSEGESETGESHE